MDQPTRWRFLNPRLPVRDVRRAQEYYRDTFGLEVRWIWSDEIGGVGIDELELYLVRKESPTPAVVSVFVDDADASYKRCIAAGATIVRSLATHKWGLRSFTVEDPDGNLIVISHEEHSPTDAPEYTHF